MAGAMTGEAGVGAPPNYESSHCEINARRAPNSAESTESSQRVLTEIHASAYQHRTETSGGNQSAGSDAPFWRFDEADTATNECS